MQTNKKAYQETPQELNKEFFELLNLFLNLSPLEVPFSQHQMLSSNYKTLTNISMMLPKKFESDQCDYFYINSHLRYRCFYKEDDLGNLIHSKVKIKC